MLINESFIYLVVLLIVNNNIIGVTKMPQEQERIKEIKELLEQRPQKIKKTVNIVFDGKQYNIRIPLDFAKKAMIKPDEDLFEFTLEISEDQSELPRLSGEIIEKENNT